MGELDPQISMALQMFADNADPTNMYSDMTKVAEGYSLYIIIHYYMFLLIINGCTIVQVEQCMLEPMLKERKLQLRRLNSPQQMQNC